ncbi:hypothetical protein [Terrihabitans soli]|nr:hypothetical protein [Terrihabitans soli]
MAKGIVDYFTELVGMLNRGTFHQQVNKEIEMAYAALEALPGGKGKAEVTVKLTLIYENGQIVIRPEVNSKQPKGGFSGNNFWLVDGRLSTVHPQQHDMFREAD